MFLLAKLMCHIASTLGDVKPKRPHRISICNRKLLSCFYFFHAPFIENSFYKTALQTDHLELNLIHLIHNLHSSASKNEASETLAAAAVLEIVRQQDSSNTLVFLFLLAYVLLYAFCKFSSMRQSCSRDRNEESKGFPMLGLKGSTITQVKGPERALFQLLQVPEKN